MEPGATRFRTSALWLLTGAAAVLGSAAWLVVTAVFIVSGDTGVLAVVGCVVVYGAAGTVLILWGLRRLTESVRLLDDCLVYSVLGKVKLIKYASIRKLLVRGPSLVWIEGNPGRFVTMCTADNQRIMLSSYLERFDDLVAEIRSRVGEGLEVSRDPRELPRVVEVVTAVVVAVIVILFVVLLVLYGIPFGR